MARLQRVRSLARELGFVGRVEYQHLYSRSGGAQFILAEKDEDDTLVTYAEAFERDADPDDFSLRAILAHERGHQILCRNARLRSLMKVRISVGSEEILASLLGSLIIADAQDAKDLVAKALMEATAHGLSARQANRLVEELSRTLEALL